MVGYHDASLDNSVLVHVIFKQIPILSNPQLMRLFSYLPLTKSIFFGAALAMIAGGGASSLIALVLGKLTDMAFLSAGFGSCISCSYSSSGYFSIAWRQSVP